MKTTKRPEFVKPRPVNTVAVLPMMTGETKAELQTVMTVIATLLNMNTVLLPPEHLHGYYDSWRGQWNADQILGFLTRLRANGALPSNASKIIAVNGADMYAYNRTFVFGYAHRRDGVTVISTARLREQWYGQPANVALENSRIARTVMHELVHTFGTGHCNENEAGIAMNSGGTPECIMNSVAQIENLDELPLQLCQKDEQVARKAIARPYTVAANHFDRGGIYLSFRSLDSAIEQYRMAVALEPNNARYWNDLGVAYTTAREHHHARAAYEKSVELDANFPHPYYNLGVISLADADLSTANRWFDEGYKRDADKLGAHKYLGKVYDEAVRDYQQALEHYRAYLNLGGMDLDVRFRVSQLKLYYRG